MGRETGSATTLGATIELIGNVTRVLNFLAMIGSIMAVAILQDKIVKLTPPDAESATKLQSWMTFFTLLFTFMGVTEVYDRTELMIFKPKIYEKLYGAVPSD